MFSLIRKKPVKCKLVDVSAEYIATGQIARYIVSLYRKRGLSHIGYEFCKDECGLSRYEIFTLPGNIQAIKYFKDRCPGMIEEAILKIDTNDTVSFRIENWKNGFTEVIDMGNNVPLIKGGN